ncbi:Flavodoxin reductase ferredoxin-NADPH reductase family 1 (plasmid) [Paraburkholderia caribensis MBA4]|uniref:Flavodoxin reductase ferredoxin-NADPH reductase family 1 n=1 Tax=Paraburkholderia caribensis MBA4 TaxID=1323664 RepID=A0A0P0RQ22_9BURK|nr:PDR/VanB family oxidoreductase [Paraburkholderia caribensis]ALL71103.1 Flavodoxin reductase ferredoxin-NADPH reductase family 1 [Paraburkholderia caribensis MBA4]
MKTGIRRIEEVAQGIRMFELAPLDGTRLPEYTPGAHIDVHLPTGIVRQYSLCGGPQQRDAYVIAVQHNAASRGGSRAMHALQVGDTLSIDGPRNHFPLANDARHSVLLAGGIGITPLLSMAERLAQTQASFELHYCVRSRERAAFLDRLDAPHLRGRCTLYIDDAPADARMDVARIVRDPLPGSHLYVCGPSGFMDYAFDTAKRAGWADRHLHREYFSAPAIDTRDNTPTARAFSVRLARSGKVVRVSEQETVVQALAAHGVCIETSCEQGVCGTCLTGVLAGDPEHRDLYLTNDERARNDQFLPCCSRSHTDELVLDL